jgi:hypothetical protein
VVKGRCRVDKLRLGNGVSAGIDVVDVVAGVVVGVGVGVVGRRRWSGWLGGLFGLWALRMGLGWVIRRWHHHPGSVERGVANGGGSRGGGLDDWAI